MLHLVLPVEDGDKILQIYLRFKHLTVSFSLWAAVYTGPGPVKDVFSTTNRMTVLFITDTTTASRGFKANFTTGYYLGIPGKKYFTPHHSYANKPRRVKPLSRVNRNVRVCILRYYFVFPRVV